MTARLAPPQAALSPRRGTPPWPPRPGSPLVTANPAEGYRRARPSTASHSGRPTASPSGTNVRLGSRRFRGNGAGAPEQPRCSGAKGQMPRPSRGKGVPALSVTIPGPGTPTSDDDDHAYGALRAGASGFMVKDMALDDILTTIRVVAAGDAMIAPAVTRRLIGQLASQPRPGRKPRELTGITDRERSGWRASGCPTPRSPPPCTSPGQPGDRTPWLARRGAEEDAGARCAALPPRSC